MYTTSSKKFASSLRDPQPILPQSYHLWQWLCKSKKNQSQKSKSLLIYWIPHNWSKPNLWFVAWISSQVYIYCYPHCFNIMRGRTITWPKFLDETAAAKCLSPKPQFRLWHTQDAPRYKSNKTPGDVFGCGATERVIKHQGKKKKPGLQQVRDATLKSLHKTLLGQHIFWRLNKTGYHSRYWGKEKEEP